MARISQDDTGAVVIIGSGAGATVSFIYIVPAGQASAVTITATASGGLTGAKDGPKHDCRWSAANGKN